MAMGNASMGEELANEMRLGASRKRAVFLLGLSLVFVGLGVVLAKEGEVEMVTGIVVICFFGLGVLMGVGMMLPGCSWLELDREGFTICSLWRKHRYGWDDIQDLRVGVIGHNEMVMFDFSEKYGRHKAGRAIADVLTGAEGALHDTFGLKAEELAALMEEFRVRYEQGQIERGG